jgi:hypothetical protein
MTSDRKKTYSFKEGLAMLAAKDVGIDPYLAAEAGEDARVILAALRRAKTAKGPEKAKHIAAAQTELRKLNPQQHGRLINALQAKVLALQGRGGDTAVAHLEPGEMVIPRSVLTPQLAELIAAEAAKRGIDPKQLIVGSRRASINPATGVEEHGLIDTVKKWFSGDKLDVETIPINAERRIEHLYPPLPDGPKPEMRFYKPWEDTEENRAFQQKQSNAFANATTREDYPAMQQIFDETKQRLTPSGIELDRNPVSAQEKEDFALIQNVRLDAHKFAEPVSDSYVQKDWPINRGKTLDRGNNFVGPDGIVYRRAPDLERTAVSPYALVESWQSPLKAAKVRHLMAQGKYEEANKVKLGMID